MKHKESPIKPSLPANASKPQFLPNICSLQAVFLLVLLGELLALALTLAESGINPFDWLDLGLRSFLIQWIVLLSAACLCPLRPWLAARPPWIAGLCCYAVVMSVALLCSLVGYELLQTRSSSVELVLENMLLSGIFAGVVLRYLYVQQQLLNQQQAELRARVQALQSRIQPHFLFNSMNSIASLIDSDPQAAERMLEDLCSLFRASLAEPALVPLASELELCRQYLAIEQTRLGSRLAVNWQLGDNVERQQSSFPIPSLLLQPLLENAIHHGIQRLPEGGEIDITIKLEGDRLSVQVSNPLTIESTVQPHQGHQLALDNIYHRLRAHFGGGPQFEAYKEGEQFIARFNYTANQMGGA